MVEYVSAILRRLGIEHHLGGSMASSFHGLPRTTADVDLVIRLAPEHLDALERELSDQFYVSRIAMEEALVSRRSFSAISLTSPLKVDFFVLGDAPFDREEFARASLASLTGGEGAQQVPIKSAEDLILRKLAWYRAGSEVSDHQWADVLGVMRAQKAKLDREYLRQWALELGVADLLTRALDEAERSS